jgi:hypothetical protein
MTEARQVRDLDDLKALADPEKGGADVFITLNFDFRSSKNVRYYPDGYSSAKAWRNRKWEVHNEIDDTWQILSEKRLWTDSHIGEALDKGALYVWLWSA